MFFSRSSSIDFCFLRTFTNFSEFSRSFELPVSIFLDFLTRMGFYPIIRTPSFGILDDHCRIPTVSSRFRAPLDHYLPDEIFLDD